MELSQYLSEGHGRAAKLADALKVARSRISEWANKKAPIPLQYMAAIETFTGKRVTRQEMCPDGWQKIWPELATQEVANPPPEKLPNHVIVEAIKANLIKDRRVFVRRAEDRKRLGLDIGTAGQGV